jgi:hypothetical protein
MIIGFSDRTVKDLKYFCRKVEGGRIIPLILSAAFSSEKRGFIYFSESAPPSMSPLPIPTHEAPMLRS